MQKCLMHAVALNEKALIPIVPQKEKTKTKTKTQRNPHILLHSTLKCIVLGLFITAQNSKSQKEIKQVF